MTGDLLVIGPLVKTFGTVIRIENANEITTSLPPTSGEMDTDDFNGFDVPKLTANTTIPAPNNPSNARKITFLFQQGAAAYTITFNAVFAFANAGSPVGVTQAQFDALVALLAEDEILMVGFEYRSAISKWCAVGLAGPFA
jgi:hypothetical protein